MTTYIVYSVIYQQVQRFTCLECAVDALLKPYTQVSYIRTDHVGTQCEVCHKVIGDKK